MAEIIPLMELVPFYSIFSLLCIVLTFIPYNHIILQLPSFCEYNTITPVHAVFSHHGKKASFHFSVVQLILLFILFSLTEAELVIEAGYIGNTWVGESAPIEFYLIVLIPDPWMRMGRGGFLRKFGWVLAEGGRIDVGHQTISGNLLYVCVIVIM